MCLLLSSNAPQIICVTSFKSINLHKYKQVDSATCCFTILHVLHDLFRQTKMQCEKKYLHTKAMYVMKH